MRALTTSLIAVAILIALVWAWAAMLQFRLYG